MRLWFGIGLLSVVALGAATAQEAGTPSRPPKGVADTIDFRITVRPSDPFDLANQMPPDSRVAAASILGWSTWSSWSFGVPAGTQAVAAFPLHTLPGYEPLLQVRPGQLVHVTINGKPKKGYYTYAASQKDPEGPLPRFDFADKNSFLPLMPLLESDWKDKDKGAKHLKHYDSFTWSRDIYVRPTIPPGPQPLYVTIHLQVCDADKCFPGTYPPLKAMVNVLKDEPLPLTAELKKRIDEAESPGMSTTGPSSPDKTAATADEGLMAFLLACVAGGIVALLTPCVWPMVPITVSFFLKQSESAHHRPATLALVYCSTIVVVLSVGGLLFLAVVHQLISSPITHFFLAGLCLYFALSLFGMYEIQLPSWLSNLTAAQEGRGGLVGTFFMALTFTIVSFACVGPVYGGTLIAGAARAQTASDWIRPIVGTLVFSVTFACPFFFLALFPALLRKMPKSGSWMNTLKVVMGFVVLAVVLKFLRSGEILWLGKAELLTYDLVLGMLIALCLLCGLYLLAFYRLPHDDPSEHLGVPRLLVSLLFLGLGFYLLPNLFHDSSGEKPPRNGTVLVWVDGFILTDPREGGLPWIANFNDGLKEAHLQKKRVFIDFTGLD